jgi:hypothetical protein
MTTTQPIKHPPSAGRHSSATPDARSPASEFPPLWERLNDILPLVFVVPMAGPPVILLLGPRLLIVLLLIPPAAVLITLVLVVVVAAGLLTALVGLVASPYLLVRHVRKTPGCANRTGARAPARSTNATSSASACLPSARHVGNSGPTRVPRAATFRSDLDREFGDPSHVNARDAADRHEHEQPLAARPAAGYATGRARVDNRLGDER